MIFFPLSNLVDKKIIVIFSIFLFISFFFFFFLVSEGRGGWEIRTTASLGVIFIIM
jgi:hypothetical protein